MLLLHPKCYVVAAMLTDQLVKYLRNTLDVTVNMGDWDGKPRLPLFLQDQYVYYRAEVCDLEFLLMIDVGGRLPAPSHVEKHVALVRSAWGGEVVYVCSQVSAYVRKRLIEARIQFIVPDNQLYLPALAIDLRERYIRAPAATQRFSPATQALVLYWIYTAGKIGLERQTPTEMARMLGYTKMTMSRAFREVDGALRQLSADKTGDVANIDRLTPRELWNIFQSYLRSPVGRHVNLPRRYFDPAVGLRAGLTALASRSMLAEPVHQVWAVAHHDWLALIRNGDVPVPDHDDADTVEVEIWLYQPKLFAKLGIGYLDGGVDPLSLYLSLREGPDERVQQALDEMLGGVRW
jgi:hypothetical protein